MLFKNRKVTPEAEVLWVKRADALAAGSLLLDDKPDREQWTQREFRTWVYAMAISRRLEKLN